MHYKYPNNTFRRRKWFIFDSACERVGLLSRCACEASPGARWSADGLFAHLPGLKTVLGDTGISKMTIV